MLSEGLAIALWESCSGDDYAMPATVKGEPPKAVGFRYEYGDATGFLSVHDRAEAFVTSTEYFSLFVPGAEERVVIEITTDDAVGLTENELGLDSSYTVPMAYHVSPYCATDVDTIKETSIQLLARVILLLCGSLAGNYLHKKHFHFLPESGIFIILGAIFGAVMLLVRGESAASDMKFDADFLTLTLLPPIIFYSGYCMPSISNFVYNGREILVLAAFGTFISTMIVGYGLFYVREIGDHALFKTITVRGVCNERRRRRRRRRRLPPFAAHSSHLSLSSLSLSLSHTHARTHCRSGNAWRSLRSSAPSTPWPRWPRSLRSRSTPTSRCSSSVRPS